MLEKKYNFREVEKNIQEFWEEEKIFKFDKESSKPIYSVDTPPPTVSGSLHYGHIQSYSQIETIFRYKKMRGYNVFYPLGFDNNGLPSERLVEKVKGIRATDVPRDEFVKLCEETVASGCEDYKNVFKSLGLSIDWDLSYETISDNSTRISQRSFLELAKNKNAYKKREPVQWCVECKTSIATAETESKEFEADFHTINFSVDGNNLPIATTRPEFLGACVAIMINPNDKRAKNLIGKKADVPLYNRKVQIIADDMVSLDKGTGVVMCCTYGDDTDIIWQKKHGLDYIKIINESGSIDPNIEFVGGLYYKKARKQIVGLLKDAGKYVEGKKIQHSVHVHERCDTPIELIPSEQWFIKTESIKSELIDIVHQINWKPKTRKNQIIDWINNLNRDWLISRQRFFGVPFPVWYCKKCNKINFAEIKDLPVNPKEQMPEKSCECGSNEFTPENDVMDTWATSSVTQLINAKWGEKDEDKRLIPMDVRPQGRDIINTWAFYSIVKSYYHLGAAPWRNLIINGWVLYDKKTKISKSKHKVKDPKETISEFGADAIRLWSTSTKIGTDVVLSEQEISAGNRFITKLWNASKFSIMQLEGYIENNDAIDLCSIDKWLLNKWEDTKQKAIKYLDEYEMGIARSLIDKFFWDDYCDNYLEIVKERLYQPEKHGYKEKFSAQQTIYNVLLEIIQFYNLYTPHITEHIYQKFYKNNKKHTSIASMQIETKSVDIEFIYFGEEIKKIINAVRKFKSNKGISIKEEVDLLEVQIDKKYIEYAKLSEKDLKACLAAKRIKWIESKEFNIKIK